MEFLTFNIAIGVLGHKGVHIRRRSSGTYDISSRGRVISPANMHA